MATCNMQSQLSAQYAFRFEHKSTSLLFTHNNYSVTIQVDCSFAVKTHCSVCMQIRRPSAQGITEASTSGSGCDNGSGAGAFSMESIEESDNLFDTDASQAKAHGYVRKMKDTEKLMEEAAARRDAVVRQRSSGRFSEDSIPKEALAEYAGDKEDEEPVSARGSRHLWRQTAGKCSVR